MLPPGQDNSVWSAFLLLIWLQDYLQDKNFTQTGEENSWAQFVADISGSLQNCQVTPLSAYKVGLNNDFRWIGRAR